MINPSVPRRGRAAPWRQRIPSAVLAASILALVIFAVFAAAAGCRPAAQPPAPTGPAPRAEVTPLRLESVGRVLSLEPLESLAGLHWVSGSCLMATAREASADHLITLRDPAAPGGWSAFSLVSYPAAADGLPEVVGFDEGKSALLAFPDTRAVWRYDTVPGAAETGRLTRLASGVHADLAPDASRVVIYSGEAGAAGPLLLDLGSGKTNRCDGMPDWEPPDSGLGATWSPDGKRYLFPLPDAEGDLGLGVRKPDGGAGEDLWLCRTGENAWGAEWSPDGAFVSFVYGARGPGTAPDKYHVLADRAAGGVGIWEPVPGGQHTAVRIELPWHLIYGKPVWSPGGSALAFAMGPHSELYDESGNYLFACDVWIVRHGDDSPLRVTDLAEDELRAMPVDWSLDGGGLLVGVWDASQGSHVGTVVVEVTRGPGAGATARPLCLEGIHPLTWLDDERLLMLRSAVEGAGHELVVYDRQGEVRLAVGPLHAEDEELGEVWYGVSPDQSHVAWIESTSAPGRGPQSAERILSVIKVARLTPAP